MCGVLSFVGLAWLARLMVMAGLVRSTRCACRLLGLVWRLGVAGAGGWAGSGPLAAHVTSWDHGPAAGQAGGMSQFREFK